MLKVQITHLQAFPHICNDLLLQYPHSGDKIPYYERLCTENYQVCGMVQVGAMQRPQQGIYYFNFTIT